MGGQYHALTALPTGKTQYPLYRRLGGAWAALNGVENLTLTRIWSPDHPASSELLYRLCCSGVLVGMILTGENHSTERKACDSATWTGLGLKRGICSRRPVTTQLTTWAMVQPTTFSRLSWDWTWASATRGELWHNFSDFAFEYSYLMFSIQQLLGSNLDPETRCHNCSFAWSLLVVPYLTPWSLPHHWSSLHSLLYADSIFE